MLENSLLGVLTEIDELKSVNTEVYLPMLKSSILVGQLDSEEEIALLDSDGTNASFNLNLLKLLYSKISTDNSTEKVQELFATFDGFINSLTPMDKSAISLGLVKLSYDILPDKHVKCTNENCNTDTFPLSLTVEEAIPPTAFTDNWDSTEPINEVQWSFEYKIGRLLFTVTGRYLTEGRLQSVIDFYRFDKDHNKLLEKFGLMYTSQDSMYAMIKSITVTTNDGLSSTYTAISDIIQIITRPNVKQQRKFKKLFIEHSPKLHYPDFSYTTQCPACASEIKVDVDPIKELLSLQMDFF